MHMRNEPNDNDTGSYPRDTKVRSDFSQKAQKAISSRRQYEGGEKRQILGGQEKGKVNAGSWSSSLRTHLQH